MNIKSPVHLITFIIPTIGRESLKNSINSLDIMNEERVNYTLPKTLSIKIKSEKSMRES